MSRGQPSSVALLNSATATGAGLSQSVWGIEKSFQVTASTTSGNGGAIVVLQVSNDGVNWLDAATFDLEFNSTGTTEGFSRSATWKHMRGKVNSISGTGSSVSLIVSNLTR
jgi:hypothetical protein